MFVGLVVGLLLVGSMVGTAVGALVGLLLVGAMVGTAVGAGVGLSVGDTDIAFTLPRVRNFACILA